MFPWLGLQTGVEMSGFSLLSGYVQSVSIQQPTEISLLQLSIQIQNFLQFTCGIVHNNTLVEELGMKLPRVNAGNEPSTLTLQFL